jgi:hypothetical protein
VLEARSRVLGPEHPDTLTALTARSNLAVLLFEQGEVDGARRHAEVVLEGRRRVLGDSHPDTRTANAILARILEAEANTAHAVRPHTK